MTVGRPQGEAEDIRNFRMSPSNGRDVKNNWKIMYEVNAKANNIIKVVPTMNLDNAFKTKATGTAYFFRGFAMLWLSPYYGDNGPNGGIPIILDTTEPAAMDSPRPASVLQNYDQIISDLREAGERLPLFSQLAPQEYGMPHKAAAWAFAARAALYAAQFDAKYYDTVIEMCDKVMGLTGADKRELFDDGTDKAFANLWRKQQNFGSEYIFSLLGSAVDGPKFHGMSFQNGGWGLYNHWGYFQPTLSLWNAFESGDTRRDATIIYPGQTIRFMGRDIVFGSSSYSISSDTGMSFRKFLSPWEEADCKGKEVNSNGDNASNTLGTCLLVNKEISAVEITKDVLSRMEVTDDKVKAYITKTADYALQQAENVDADIAGGAKISVLAGIPAAIKDNICTKGLKTTCASYMLENFVPPYNATVMDKVLAQKPALVGKLNMDEFAMGGSTENSAFFATHNPWNLDCVPGGSSGGSAAAVSAGSAIWALGSDTGGSIRQPASFCGVVGLKPTYGRVSRYGLVAFASSLDQIGPLTRDVTDCAHVMNVIAGHDEKDSTSINSDVPDYTKSLVNDIKGLKIGLPKEYFIDGMDEDVKKAMNTAIEDLKKLGAEIVDISLPHTDYAISTYYLIAPAEASTNLSRYDGVSYGSRVDGEDIVSMMTNTRTAKFGPEVKRRIMIGNYALSAGYYDAYYLKALKVRTLVKQDFDNAFKDVDVILAPVAPTPAYKLGSMANDPLKMYLMDIFTVPLNLAGLPGISIPCGRSKDNMPIGM